MFERLTLSAAMEIGFKMSKPTKGRFINVTRKGNIRACPVGAACLGTGTVDPNQLVNLSTLEWVQLSQQRFPQLREVVTYRERSKRLDSLIYGLVDNDGLTRTEVLAIVKELGY